MSDTDDLDGVIHNEHADTVEEDGRVIPAQEGETYRALIGEQPYYDEDEGWLDSRIPSERFDVIGPKCTHDEPTAGFWCCITHGTTFTNQFQKDMHIHAGPHVLAWLCLEHGLVAP
jgi:hypothetical protein